jgi:hypothetical protein
MRTPQNAIPDAVLNRTRCIVVALSPGDRGVASCRGANAPERWLQPMFVRLSGARGSNTPDTDFLLLVLTERCAELLQSGALDLGGVVSRPGLLERQTPSVTDSDLAFDVYSYALRGDILAPADFPRSQLSRDELLQGAFGSPPAGLADRLPHSPTDNEPERWVNWVTSYFNTITPIGIILHHTAVVPAEHRVPTNELQVDRYHQARGFHIYCFGHEYHVAYHYLIFPDGRVQAGRPERCEGAHARGYNAYLGISLIGDFSSKDNADGKKGLAKPTPEQIRSLVALVRQLRSRYHIPLQRILRHADVSPTACPGDRLPFKRILAELERSQ